jgi:hypothetical protein
MVRVLFEISLPFAALAPVRSCLEQSALPAGIVGRLEVQDGAVGCQTPARGGEAAWTPCWISIEGERRTAASLREPLRRLRAAVVKAARHGSLEVYAIPATAQIGEEFRRYRDLLDILPDLG